MKETIFKDLITIENDIKNILLNSIAIHEYNDGSQNLLIKYKEAIEQTVNAIHPLHSGIKSFIEDSNTIKNISSNNHRLWKINNTFSLFNSKNGKVSELTLVNEDEFSFLKVDPKYEHNNDFTLDFKNDANHLIFMLKNYNHPDCFDNREEGLILDTFLSLVGSYIEDSFQNIHNNYSTILINNTKRIIDCIPLLLLAEKHDEIKNIFPISKPYSLLEAIAQTKTPEVQNIFDLISLENDTNFNVLFEKYVLNNDSQTVLNKNRRP